MSSSLIDAARDEPVVPRTARQDVNIVSARKPLGARLGDVWRYRQLLLSLVRKELKVKYKGSVLGFAWSLLNPAFTLTIYYIVFTYLVPNRVPQFVIYLLSGLLVWNIFSQSLAGAVGSVTGNAAIVKKVSFPREILPLASIGAALFNGLLQSIVMVIALFAFWHQPSFEYFALLPVAVVVLTLLSSAIGIFLAAVNVKFRDTQHLLEVALSLWFWLTPIVYNLGGRIAEGLKEHNLGWLYFANPVTPIVLTFQNAFYSTRPEIEIDGRMTSVVPNYDLGWYLTHLGIVAAISMIIMWIALSIFGKLEGNFAEEL